MTHGSARTWRASLRSPDRDGTLVGWPCTRFIGPGAELDRAVRLLKKKYRQYRDYERRADRASDRKRRLVGAVTRVARRHPRSAAATARSRFRSGRRVHRRSETGRDAL